MRVRETRLEGGAGRNFTNFRIFNNPPTKFFDAGLEQGTGEIVAVHVEAGEWLEEAAQPKDGSVELRKAWGRLGIDEGRAPAVGVNEFDEVMLGLGLDTGPKEAAAGTSSLPADVVEGRSGTLGFEHVGGGEGVGVGDLAVALFGDLGGGDAKTKEADIDGSESFLYRGVIQKVLVDKGAEFGIRVHQRTARDGADFVDNGSGAAGFEDGVAD